jgi:hypothetical protein
MLTVKQRISIFSVLLSAFLSCSSLAHALNSTPPVLSGGTPVGSIPAGTKSLMFSVTTDKPATCRYYGWPGGKFERSIYRGL